MLKGNNWQSRISLLRKSHSRMKDKNKVLFIITNQRELITSNHVLNEKLRAFLRGWEMSSSGEMKTQEEMRNKTQSPNMTKSKLLLIESNNDNIILWSLN